MPRAGRVGFRLDLVVCVYGVSVSVVSVSVCGLSVSVRVVCVYCRPSVSVN